MQPSWSLLYNQPVFLLGMATCQGAPRGSHASLHLPISGSLEIHHPWLLLPLLEHDWSEKDMFTYISPTSSVSISTFVDCRWFTIYFNIFHQELQALFQFLSWCFPGTSRTQASLPPSRPQNSRLPVPLFPWPWLTPATWLLWICLTRCVTPGLTTVKAVEPPTSAMTNDEGRNRWKLPFVGWLALFDHLCQIEPMRQTPQQQKMFFLYPSSHNHSSVKNEGCISNMMKFLSFGLVFHWTIIVGERVTRNESVCLVCHLY